MTKVFGDYTQEELDRQYEHRNIVANAEEFTARGRAESKRIRETIAGPRDIAYGPEPRQKLDVYPAGRPNAPVVVWFHGGRWQMNSKEDSCRPAETMATSGPGTTETGIRTCKQRFSDLNRPCPSAKESYYWGPGSKSSCWSATTGRASARSS